MTKVIDLAKYLPEGPLAKIYERVDGPIDHFLGITAFNQGYAVAAQSMEGNPPEAFWGKILKAPPATYQVTRGSIKAVPKEGPCVIVANHPFGMVEAAIIGDLLQQRRSDTLFLANYVLQMIPLLSPLMIPVDPFGEADSAKRNIGPMKQALKHLKSGHSLVVFPAGEVMHRRFSNPKLTESAWNHHFMGLVNRTNASVIPMFIEGANSLFFQLSGMLHPSLRTLQLVREFMNKHNSGIGIRIGEAVTPESLRHMDAKEATRFLREKTFGLVG